MLVVALELRPAIKKYCQNHESELEDDELTPEDQRRLRTIKDFLEPFQLATLYTEGDCAVIDRVGVESFSQQMFQLNTFNCHL